MKVMIVEDEPLLRQGLIRKIDWQALGLELAGEADDGLQAMSMLPDCRPDIVLTDIRMPGMDGLEFIGQARGRDPGLKFIVISGFNEFEYARTALQYNVKDYLLKPIDKEKLHSLLADLCKELREERQDKADLSRLHELNEWIRQGHLQPLDFRLTHLLTEADARRDGLPPSLLGCARFAAAVVRIARGESCRFAAHEGNLARFAVQNVLTNALHPLDGTIAVVFKHAYHPEEIGILLGSEAGIALDAASAALTKASAWIRGRFGLSVSFGLSGPKGELTQLCQIYNEAHKALQSRLLLGGGGPMGESGSCDEIIASVKRHIETHYAEELSLQWVAQTYPIHPNYFSKRFKLVVGVSFSDYVTRIRMQRARELLRTTTLKIAQIAQLVGYEDQNYFCSVFKRATGVSPSAYRG